MSCVAGGVSGTYIGYIMPGMLYLRLADYRLAFWKNKGREWETFKDMFAPAVLFVFGVVAFVGFVLLALSGCLALVQCLWLTRPEFCGRPPRNTLA